MQRVLVFSTLALAALACGAPSPTATNVRPLSAVCVDQRADAPAGAWFCGEAREVECTGDTTDVERIYVAAEDTQVGLVCPSAAPAVSASGPFAVGEHSIAVATPGLAPCSSTLRIVDRAPPTGTDRVVALWPPNHKMHHVSAGDCVRVEDRCDPHVEVWFTYIAGDEPINTLGDGNTGPDVVLGCDGAEIRAERQGPSDGRVYTLGWRAEDSSGNVAEGTCTVGVVHDQRGRPAARSPEAYRVDAPAGCGGNGGGGNGGGGTPSSGTPGGGGVPPT